MDAIPTVIAFFGPGPQYLKLALRSAADFNREVVLIGDETNRGFWNNQWDSSTVPLPKLDEFNRSYVQMSDYPVLYERAFWRRPFAVEAWMRSEGVARLWLLDSDVLTFADYTSDRLPLLPAECHAAMMTPQNQSNYMWASSLHFSYWTLEALADFTSYCVAAYRDPLVRSRLEEKHRWHLARAQPGGICEMTLLYLWSRGHGNGIANLAEVCGGMAGDAAIGTAMNYLDDEYELRGGFKKFEFRNGIPHGFNRPLRQKVRFLCVHCQGASKQLMPYLYARRLRGLYRERYALSRHVDAARAKARSAVRAVMGALRWPR